MSELQVGEATERQVIEAVLRDNRCYYGLGLGKRHFEDARHRRVWEAIESMAGRGLAVTLSTLAGELADMASHIAGYHPVTAANVEYNAGQLRERSRKAELVALLKDALARSETMDSSAIIDYATTELLRVNNEMRDGLRRVSEFTVATLDRMEAARKRGGKLPGVGSGFRRFDTQTGGFRAAELCILAARTSIGKTAFALNIAESMSREHEVAFFSCEMSRAEIMDRLVSSVSGITHQRIRRGQLDTGADFTRVSDALSRIHDSKLWICDTPNIRLEDMRNQARMFRAMGGEVVIIDYLTLVKYGTDTRMMRAEREGAKSAELKAMARELEVPVIALSQLNREGEGQRPSLAQLRQSGEIEENADMILLLHRERGGSETDCIIAKHRNGPEGVVHMHFNAEMLRFAEVDE